MEEFPNQPIIDGRREASLNVGGRLLVLIGLIITMLGNLYGLVVLLVGAGLLEYFLVLVAERLALARNDRRQLRRWLRNGSFYRSLVALRYGDDGSIAKPDRGMP